jgi:hypothetical protein
MEHVKDQVLDQKPALGRRGCFRALGLKTSPTMKRLIGETSPEPLLHRQGRVIIMMTQRSQKQTPSAAMWPWSPTLRGLLRHTLERSQGAILTQLDYRRQAERAHRGPRFWETWPRQGLRRPPGHPIHYQMGVGSDLLRDLTGQMGGRVRT